MRDADPVMAPVSSERNLTLVLFGGSYLKWGSAGGMMGIQLEE